VEEQVLRVVQLVEELLTLEVAVAVVVVLVMVEQVDQV
jgi:hypothetical protein